MTSTRAKPLAAAAAAVLLLGLLYYYMVGRDRQYDVEDIRGCYCAKDCASGPFLEISRALGGYGVEFRENGRTLRIPLRKAESHELQQLQEAFHMKVHWLLMPDSEQLPIMVMRTEANETRTLVDDYLMLMPIAGGMELKKTSCAEASRQASL